MPDLAGVLAALTAALMWTLSSMLWGRIQVTAFVLNAAKNSIGLVLILLHLAAISLFLPDYNALERIPNLDGRAWGWLFFSALSGIVVGDTFFFRSLQILGPRRALIVACFSPLFATVLGVLFADQILNVIVMTGIFMTMSGVIAVVTDRRAEAEAPGLMPGSFASGVACGITAAACQAIGGLCSKNGMEFCLPIEATLIRLAVATAASGLALAIFRKKNRTPVHNLFSWKLARFLVPATAIGTWLGIWFSQISYSSQIDLAVIQTLLSTCPLFAIPIVWLVYGHKPNRLAIVGTVIAIFGIWLSVSGEARQPTQDTNSDRHGSWQLQSEGIGEPNPIQKSTTPVDDA